jgi:hypothetical protein
LVLHASRSITYAPRDKGERTARRPVVGASKGKDGFTDFKGECAEVSSDRRCQWMVIENSERIGGLTTQAAPVEIHVFLGSNTDCYATYTGDTR